MNGKPNCDPCFPATRWTLVMRLGSGDEQIARPALAELCSLYHFPLYCFIRRRGFDHHDAEDALHDFFAKLLRLDSLSSADPHKGRLRSYLATALHRFLIDWRKASRKASAPDWLPPCIASGDGLRQRRFEIEIGGAPESPEVLLDRRWAHELLARVIRDLRENYSSRGKLPLFDTLLPVLLAGGSLQRGQSATLAPQLGMSDGALRVALSRLLRDYRQTLEAAVLETVDDREQVPEEIAYLLSLFSRN